MTSSAPNELFVWIWLPGATEPVVAGRLAADGPSLVFNYGRSYLARKNAMAIHNAELPLENGELRPLPGLTMAGCLRDASPDAWGRRVILNRLFGHKGKQADTAKLDELSYLLESGSDRIGALDFQKSASTYVPRLAVGASLDELQTAAELVEQGVPLTNELDLALRHGSSIGGARPKALIVDGAKKHIAKFSAASDLYSVVKAEFVAMRLAALAGLAVAPVTLVKSANKDVLLVERFDRSAKDSAWQRHALISALTLLQLDEMMARYASYEDLAQIIRYEFIDPKPTLKELFARLSFNILCGNTDDHARNHAALWDGTNFRLSPAYDLCPQPRAGGEATQAMAIIGQNRSSQLATCLDAAHLFLLSRAEAIAVIERLVSKIGEHWDSVCAAATLGAVDRQLLATRAFLVPYAFEYLDGDAMHLRQLGELVRRSLV